MLMHCLILLDHHYLTDSKYEMPVSSIRRAEQSKAATLVTETSSLILILFVCYLWLWWDIHSTRQSLRSNIVISWHRQIHHLNVYSGALVPMSKPHYWDLLTLRKMSKDHLHRNWFPPLNCVSQSHISTHGIYASKRWLLNSQSWDNPHLSISLSLPGFRLILRVLSTQRNWIHSLSYLFIKKKKFC